jgi:hypothetical protein
MKASYAEDFEIVEVDDDGYILSIKCKVCTEYLGEIRREIKRRGWRGAVYEGLTKYVDGVKGAHRGNILCHVKDGGLHQWAKTTKGGRFVFKRHERRAR